MALKFSRTSKYIPGSDGTKLALDIYIPETSEKVPVLLKAGYAPRRAEYENDKEAIDRFIGAGYAVAIVEVRGSGASFGVSDGFYGRNDGKDLACIIDALTKEEWCNGKAGTYGGSNYGMSQEITLIEQPERLFAAIPCDNSMDFYDQDFPNGVSAIPNMGGGHHETPLGDPVDDDPAPDYPMAHEALRSHERNLPFLAQHYPNMWRDDVHPLLGYRPNIDVPAWERMDDVRFGHAAVWSVGAWFDPGCTNKILTWKSWGGKLLIGPWMHCGIYRGNTDFPNADYDWVSEHIRWFDAHLKDTDTGITGEPPVMYYCVGDTGNEWHRSADFPVDGTTFPRLHLTHTGKLTENTTETGSVSYKVRDDIMIYDKFGRMNRNIRRDMTSEDEKSITFDSEPLPKDMEITGIPSLDIWVTSTHTDGNFIACLEEITPDGISHFITEGMIRASHAKTHHNNIYDSMGIPYHRGYREDKVELSETDPMKLSFHLEAFSRIIRQGSRLRVSISCGGSGFQQPEGFPSEMPTIKIYTGPDTDSALTLPIIKPIATVFSSAHEESGEGKETLYVYKRAVYLEKDGKFTEFPCKQCYPEGNQMVYETESFTVRVRTEGRKAYATAEGSLSFSGESDIPDRFTFGDTSGEIPLMRGSWGNYPDVDVKNMYVATVPVAKGDYGNVNPQLRNTFDIFIDLIYPEGERKNLPCVINIHGFGGNHHQFESNTDMFLKRGFAVASVDYRLCPPNIWPSSGDDVRGCIRYLKAHSGELGLDASRFAVVGGSMGGHLTAMLAACNGDPSVEGNIGGNTFYDCSVKAAAAFFAFTDFFRFGEDSAAVSPAQPDKVAQSDGPFAPLGSMIGYVGAGKGMGDVKAHLFDQNPKYKELRQKAVDASPISHVTASSAPFCLVHGIYDYGVQVPMGQSVRMFEAYTRKGVKSLLLCNNNGPFGEDPEIKRAVVDFIGNLLNFG